MTSGEEILDTIVRGVDAGGRMAICAIVVTRGSTPQPAGTMVCVDEAARLTGTLGGGCVEADVRRRAHQLLSTGRGGLMTFTLDGDFGFDDGMICGGRMDVAVGVLAPFCDLEPYRKAAEQLHRGDAATVPVRVEAADGPVEYRVSVDATPDLVIAGAGHISRVLAGMAVRLDFRVQVVDDRAEYASAARFPAPIRTTVGDIATTLKAWPIGANTYVVIVTRGHRHDAKALLAVLDSPARYIGMLGSRRKVLVIFDDLRHAGATTAQLDRVHAPIGLEINAVTTDEIALSIAAELVSVRRVDRRSAVEGPIAVSRGAG